MEGPQNAGRMNRIRYGPPPVIFANRYAFAKTPEPPKKARASGPQPPLQPWTWFQLATIFCFTGSGNATKSSSAAI
jgi:hypothetical protein